MIETLNKLDHDQVERFFEDSVSASSDVNWSSYKFAERAYIAIDEHLYDPAAHEPIEKKLDDLEALLNKKANDSVLLDVNVDGPKIVVSSVAGVYLITDYSAWSDYTVTSTIGTITYPYNAIDKSRFSLVVAPGVSGVAQLTVTRITQTSIDSSKVIVKKYNVAINQAQAIKPIAYVTGGASGISINPSFTASVFATTGGTDSLVSTTYQLYSDSLLTSLVASASGPEYNTGWNLTSPNLSVNTNYWIRVKQAGAIYTSEWSDATQFRTLIPYVNAPTITAPTMYPSTIPYITSTIVFTKGAFSTTPPSPIVNDTRQFSDYIMSSDIGFNLITSQYQSEGVTKQGAVDSSGNWIASGLSLSPDTLYYVKAKDKGNTYGWSNYGPTIMIKTAGLPDIQFGIGYLDLRYFSYQVAPDPDMYTFNMSRYQVGYFMHNFGITPYNNTITSGLDTKNNYNASIIIKNPLRALTANDTVTIVGVTTQGGVNPVDPTFTGHYEPGASFILLTPNFRGGAFANNGTGTILESPFYHQAATQSFTYDYDTSIYNSNLSVYSGNYNPGASYNFSITMYAFPYTYGEQYPSFYYKSLDEYNRSQKYITKVFTKSGTLPNEAIRTDYAYWQ